MMKGGVMGEIYLMQRGAETAHLPMLAVPPFTKFAIGENNNA
jgi:hypothetical protein